MPDFLERLVVESRDHEASRNFAAFLGEQTIGDPRIRVSLRLPANVFSARRALIERRVVATLLALHSGDNATSAYSVVWTSQAIQPFPLMTGMLSVETSPGDDRIVLLLNGHVEPPADYAASSGDAALHDRIAHAAACSLLRAIAEYIDHAAAHNAAARAGFYRRYPAMTAVV